MGKPIEYKKIEMNISWISTKKEPFEEVSKTSWIVKGKNNVPGFIAKNVFCGNYDENVKDAYLKILRQCNGISNSNANDALKYRTYSFIVLDTEWAAEKFTNFKDLVNTDPVLMGKIVISESSKDEYDRQKKEYDKKNISTDAKNSNFDQTNGKKEIKKNAPADNEKLRDEIEAARKQMVFCDEAIVSTSDIVNLLVGENGIFPDADAMKNVLKERYLKMRGNFKERWETDDCWIQKTFNIVHGSSDALLKVPASICKCTLTEKIFTNDVTNIGHDLPIWLYYGKKNAQSRRVMIISQDPKRAGHSGNDLLLSTPWAHHSLEFLLRKPRFPQLMAMRLVHSYLKRGDIVYLTDYKKLYWTGASTGIYLDSTYQKILKKEIEYFNPDFIVSLGDQAAEALTGGWHDEKKKIDHRNKKCSLLPGLCPDRNNIPNVYVKYHTNARSNHNPHYNDPEYWYVAPSEEQGSSGDQNGFIASNDISKQGDKQ